MFENKSKEEATKEILEGVREYYSRYMKKGEYRDGDRIAYASRVFDEKEMVNLVDSSLEFWLTSGRIMNSTFWVGVYPGMTDAMLDRMVKVILESL